MKTTLSIAIYSGEIPSTRFIERLILGLSKAGCAIYLFGVVNKGRPYASNIHVFGYKSSRWFKLIYLLKYSLLLLLKKASEKRRLDAFLKAEGRHDLYSRIKYYPVLYHQPDVFHLQWAKGIAEWFWVEDFGMHLVLSLRGAHIHYSPIADADLAATYAYYFPKLSGFHAVSDAIAKEALCYGAMKSNLDVVYNGLDMTQFAKSTPFKGVIKQLNILSVGESHWKKGYVYALDACKLLQQEAIPFHYTIIGGANDMELQYQVHDLDLHTVVSLLEPMHFENVRTYIRDADVLLLPSVEEDENNLMLEAMALGTLVISTDCNGIQEFITEGHNGFLVPIRDPEALAIKLAQISGLSESDKAFICDSAQATIAEQHSEAKMVAGMLDLYQDVIGFSPNS